jgi:hypothetical protein
LPKIDDISVDKMSKLKFVNAVPASGAFDIYLNDRPLVSGLAYKGKTSYVKILPGDYTITVRRAGSNTVLRIIEEL